MMRDTGCGIGEKIPKNKFQITNKIQDPISKIQYPASDISHRASGIREK